MDHLLKRIEHASVKRNDVLYPATSRHSVYDIPVKKKTQCLLYSAVRIHGVSYIQLQEDSVYDISSYKKIQCV